MTAIRFFDILFSLIGLIILSPFLLLVSLLIKLSSKGPVIFIQQRVGKNNIDFGLYKFRSMNKGAAKRGLLTVGGKDSRITRVGYFLRKFKIDELPQLFNVLKGEMSLVGPRPELRKFVDYYTPDQLKILEVLPGITDYASIIYRNENNLLATVENPEQFYIDVIMPEKIRLNFKYIENRIVSNYFKIIWLTIRGVLKKRPKINTL